MESPIYLRVLVPGENAEPYQAAASQSRLVGMRPFGVMAGAAGDSPAVIHSRSQLARDLRVSDLAKASHLGSVDFARVPLVAAGSLGDVKQRRRDQYHSGDRDRVPLHWLVAC